VIGLTSRLLPSFGLALVVGLAACAAPAAPGASTTGAGAAAPTAPAKPTSAPPPPAASAPTAAPAAAADPPLSPPVAVTMGTLGLASDAAFYIAMEKGYFTAQGLDVQDTRFDAGARLIPALASSQIDVGAGSPSAGLFNALKRNIPIEIVGDKGRAGTDSSYMSLLVRKELLDGGAVRDSADFRGRKIASIANDNSNVIQIDRMMRGAGLTHKDLDIVVLPGGDMIAALANGNIDAAMVAEPIPTRAVASGAAVRWKGSNEFYPDQQAAVVMYAPTFGKDKPEAARRFMIGYVQGLRLYYDAFFKNRNRAEVVQILTRHTSLTDPRLFDEMVPFAVDPDGGVNAQSLADDLEWLVREGFVPEKPDLGAHVNLSYVDYATSRLGKYER
jgi:ABC-type nitrate/sulfonate/bicarbonate transport system substrate-binding protein